MSSSLEDSSQGQTLPMSMRYSTMVPLGLSATSKKVTYFAQNAGTFTKGNSVIRIPISSSSCFLDPQLTYLKFTYTNDTKENQHFDGSASSLIQRIRIYSKSGGGDLEDVRNYGQLVNMLSDLQYGLNERFTKSHEGYGSGGFMPSALPEIKERLYDIKTNADGKIDTFALYGGAGVRSLLAEQVASATSAGATASSLGTKEPTIAAAGVRTVCIPLLSSLIGSGGQKYLPLFLTGELVLEIELAHGTGTYSTVNVEQEFKISDVSLHCQLITFSSTINDALIAMTLRAGIRLHGCCWTSSVQSIPNGTNAVVIADRLKSVKSLFMTFSKSRGAVNTIRALARNNNNISSLKFHIGSEYYPNQAITCTSTNDATIEATCGEFMIETLKAIGEFSNVNHTGLMNSANFANNDATATSCGRSVYGIDLDAFSKQNLQSGLNMVLNNPCIIEYTKTGGEAVLDCYVHLLHDAVFVITPNGSMTVEK